MDQLSIYILKRRYGANVTETIGILNPPDRTQFNEDRGFHKAFNKGGTPLLVTSS